MNREKVKGAVRHPITVLLDYFFIAITILQCNSVFYRAGNHLAKVQILWLILTLIIFFRSVIKIFLSKTDITRLLLFLLLFSLIEVCILGITYQVTALPKGTVILYLVAPIMLVTIFFGEISFENGAYLFIVYKNIMLALAMVSLIFWLLAMLGVPTTMNTAIQWGGYHQVPGYLGVHYISQGSTNFLGINMVRNTGLFVEAPMYSYVLSIGLLILLFVDERLIKKRKNEILLLVITILTTTSTTGTIVALLAIVYDMLIVKNKAPLILKVIIVTLGMLLVGILVRIILLRKIQGGGAGSVNIRWNDIQAGFYAWKDHPLIGNGFGNYDSIMAYMDPSRLVMNGNGGFSSGLMETLAYGGILAGLFQIVPTFLTLAKSKKLFGLAVISFVLFVVTIVDNVYIYTMLLSYIWAEIIFKKAGSEKNE
ncbi:O-antigen ligase family protein [Levilactobacillus yiduensis]|uniref:O-antigen ligase family protein n=1 Tax=Levilactobacillus yiduensis TaxID=2953880 RepID=UPI000EF3291E|nr:O-antigen ligase family protein [Levilactobacillus yiduensis]AYM02792.1 hypothetical protein D8911_07220 [Levilactobacillus brevis]